MVYLDKKTRQVVLEMFGAYDATRKGPTEHGYTFTERDVFSNHFWGVAFIIDKPRGKGATARLDFLFTEFWKAYSGWAN